MEKIDLTGLIIVGLVVLGAFIYLKKHFGKATSASNQAELDAAVQQHIDLALLGI
jgi:hypothetical protein